MTRNQHVLRVIGLMAVAAGLLITMMARTEVMFADGLRYIDQAQRIRRGPWRRPAPGDRSSGIPPGDRGGPPGPAAAKDPMAWQRAAQAASVAGGRAPGHPALPRVAWSSSGLGSPGSAASCSICAPIPCRVMADALSESTFLLFWCWGLWTAIRFLREGSAGLVAADGRLRRPAPT